MRRGGFSVVFKAVKKEDKQEYAIKCIKKKMVQGDDIKLLRREIQIMKCLDHPNILKLFDVFEDEDQFYLVMELYALFLVQPASSFEANSPKQRKRERTLRQDRSSRELF